MNVKIINQGTSKKGNENSLRKILTRQNGSPKPSQVFHSVSMPSPLLSDRNEFPSLSESTGRVSNSLPSSGGSLMYSEKLKSSSSSKNQTSLSGKLLEKFDYVVTSTCNEFDDKIIRSKFQKSPGEFKKDNYSKKTITKRDSEHSTEEHCCLSEKQIQFSERSKFTEQKSSRDIKVNPKNKLDKTTPFISDNCNLFSKSNNQIHSNKSIKSTTENCESKVETNETQDSFKTKKKRKSKIKRQVALKSGKITVLTPEVHSKILNQASALTASNFRSVVVDLNDEVEYPELGKPITSTNQKENFHKKNILLECQKKTLDKPTELSAEKNIITGNIVEESSKTSICDQKTTVEKKGKEKVHSHNPITISFYDMLLEKNLKPKKEVTEPINETNILTTVGLSKIKEKKSKCHPHNLLDSSSPAIKRGKEREKPKPKKPSQLKKVILLDRKTRKEHLLLMKSKSESAVEENVISGNELMSKSCTKDENEISGSPKKTNQYGNNSEVDFTLPEVDDEDPDLLSVGADLILQNELVPEIEHISLSDVQESISMTKDLSSSQKEEKVIDFIEKSMLNESCSKMFKNESPVISDIEIKSVTYTETPLFVPRSPDALINSLTRSAKSSISDKEKAAKILLHTRNFREYCNHLISKDIDDAVFALLDDLARFQDRLHLKDPVKARMKRRMIYGVKEVKKHIKLKKLKCIVIAVDIENVETQGGLNDVLSDIKILAVDHHIPCVFALSRKVLGKVCHKPVPVSCVGVFNYEGSEANFKKMVELQTQSKADYIDIFNKLVLKLTEEEATTLIKAKKEAPETLRAIRTDILNDFFLLSEAVKFKDENIDLTCSEQTSNIIDSEA